MESLMERCPPTRALLHSSIKVPGIWAPPPIPGSPQMERSPHRERCLYLETFLTYIPGSSVKELLQREILHPQSHIHPGRQDLLQVPQMGPVWKEMPISRTFSTYPSGSPAGKPSLQVRFTDLPQRETPHLQSPFQPYLKVPSRWAHSRLPNWAPIKRDSHPQSLPFITFRAPTKAAPPPGSPNIAPIERDAPSPETPYNNLSEFLGHHPMGWCPSPELSSPYPSKSPERSSPNRAPTERDASFPEPTKNTKSTTPQISQRASEARGACLQNFLLHLCVKVPGKWPPPPPCSSSGSPWREKLHLQSQWLIHLFISVGVPNKGLSHKKRGKYLVTVHGAPRGQKAYIQWGAAWFPKRII